MTVKNRRRFGKIRKLPSNKYQASFISPTGKRIYAPCTFENKSMAELFLQKNKMKIELGEWTEPKIIDKNKQNQSFVKYATNFIDNKNIRDTSKRQYCFLLKNHINNYFNKYQVTEITDEIVNSWYKQLPQDQLTLKRHAYTLLSSIFNNAVENEIINKNPCNIQNAKSKKKLKTTDLKLLSTDEKIKLINSIDKQYRLTIILGLYLGLRIGEALALQRKDVNFDNKTLSITKSVHHVFGKAQITPPKNNSSIRKVPIPSKFINDFKNHFDNMKYKTPTSYLFPRKRDKMPINASLFRGNYYNKARHSIGRDDLRYHDLRHICLTNYAQNGATIYDLMKIAGHSSPDIVMVYQETSDDRLQNLADLT
jgi:integrase